MPVGHDLVPPMPPIVINPVVELNPPQNAAPPIPPVVVVNPAPPQPPQPPRMLNARGLVRVANAAERRRNGWRRVRVPRNYYRRYGYLGAQPVHDPDPPFSLADRSRPHSWSNSLRY